MNTGPTHVQKARNPFSIYPLSDFSLHHVAIGTDSIIIRSSRIDLHPCGSVPRKEGGWKGINKGVEEEKSHPLWRAGDGSVVLSARHVWLRGGSSLEIALRVFPWCTLTGTRFRAERRRLSSLLFICLAPLGFSWPCRAGSESLRPFMQLANFGNNKYKEKKSQPSVTEEEETTIVLLFTIEKKWGQFWCFSDDCQPKQISTYATKQHSCVACIS